jgi:hypothetical protein
MTADALKKITTDALDTLAALLDEGHSEALTAYLALAGRFHSYSFRNVMLIASQRPDATRVAGFNAWRKLGRFVKKGEKGIAIIAPIVFKRDDHAAGSDDECAGDVQLRFKVAHVFDLRQTDGEPLPEVAEASGDPGSKTAALRTAIVTSGIAIESSDDLDGARGTSAGGRIQILNGLSAAEELLVIAHEWAHELLHRADDRPASRDTRELEAEAVAFVIGEAVGLDARASSRDYLHLYNGDREALAGSLDRIQRAASVILAAVSASD